MMSRKWLAAGCLAVCLAIAVPTALANVSDPNIITGVVQVNSTRPDAPLVVNGGLTEGAKIFVDRDNFFYGDVGAFEGLDYIQTVMDDKTNPDVEYHVIVNKPGTLFLFVDNRVGNGEASDPPVLGEGVMNWAIEMGFEVSPFAINFSEPATAYALPVSGDPNTIVLGPQNDGSSRAMYTIAAAPAGWNFPPVVEGVPSSAQVAPGETLKINAVVSDDGFPEDPGEVTVMWSVEDAPDGAIVTFDPDIYSTDVEISFSELGEYTLKLTADDGDKVTEKVIAVAIAIPSYVLQAADWCDVCNDSNTGPNSTRRSSISDIKNYNDGSAQRRRVSFYRYNIADLKQEGKVFANSYLTYQVDKWTNPAQAHVYAYAINEELDGFTLQVTTWNTAPGVMNSPTPPLNSEITIETLDTADISPLLLSFQVSTLDVWEDSAKFPGLDEALNADTDGSIVLMFICHDPESKGFEFCSPSHSRSLTMDGVAKKGILLNTQVATPTWATNPVPVMNTSQGTGLSQLSWTNPAGVGDITCDVYIGIGEPNASQADYGYTTLGTGISGNSVSIPSGLLSVNTVYNWIVDVHDSVVGTTRGYVWSFNTNNAMPTVTMEKPFQYLWLGNDGDPTSATAVLNATVEDDNFPAPYTLLWEQVSAPEGVEVVIDPNDVEDIMLVLPQAGTYVFKLSADDTGLVGSASTEIFVGADPCEAAQAKPDYVQNPADFNNDCFVDLSDFAFFAAQWLECNPAMDAPCH